MPLMVVGTLHCSLLVGTLQLKIGGETGSKTGSDMRGGGETEGNTRWWWEPYIVAFWWGHYNLDRGETGSETGGDIGGKTGGKTLGETRGQDGR